MLKIGIFITFIFVSVLIFFGIKNGKVAEMSYSLQWDILASIGLGGAVIGAMLVATCVPKNIMIAQLIWVITNGYSTIYHTFHSQLINYVILYSIFTITAIFGSVIMWRKLNHEEDRGYVDPYL